MAKVVNILEQQILKTAFNKIGTVPAIVSQTLDAFERRALAHAINQWKQSDQLLKLSLKIKKNFAEDVFEAWK